MMRLLINEPEETGIEAGMPVAGAELIDTMQRAAEVCLVTEGIDPDWIEISLSFVSAEEIHALNREHRGVDQVTDVLSFPLVEDLDELPGLEDEAEPEDGPLRLEDEAEPEDEPSGLEDETGQEGEPFEPGFGFSKPADEADPVDESSEPESVFSNSADEADTVDEAKQEDEADTEEWLIPLGDVVICLEQAEAQAAEYGHSRQREIVYLFVHSVLHLLGYDHMEPEEQRLMRAREEEVMAAVELPR